MPTTSPRTGLVLQRTPGHHEWTEARYTVGPEGFGVRNLQMMAGDGLFEFINLDNTFSIVCNEEGRLRKLPVAMSVGLTKGTDLPIFGPFAVVRIGRSLPGGRGRPCIGLRKGDADHIKSAYAWHPVQA